MTEMARRYMGNSVPRKEDPALLTGHSELHRRHPAAGHAAHGLPAKPPRPRQDHLHRRLGRQGAARRRGRLYRRGPGRRVGRWREGRRGSSRLRCRRIGRKRDRCIRVSAEDLLRLARHGGHQDPAPLAPGPRRGQLRRRRRGRRPRDRPLQGPGRPGVHRSRIRADGRAVVDIEAALEDGAPAGARRVRDQRVLHLAARRRAI